MKCARANRGGEGVVDHVDQGADALHKAKSIAQCCESHMPASDRQDAVGGSDIPLEIAEKGIASQVGPGSEENVSLGPEIDVGVHIGIGYGVDGVEANGGKGISIE